jgi:L-threonylcarbamoyladenylate synthase
LKIERSGEADETWVPGVIPVDLEAVSDALLSEIAGIIRGGGVVAIPTDTLYGLAADPFNLTAVERLFAIKRRAPSKPISLLISDRPMLETLVSDLSPEAKRLIDTFWPGPLTLIFKNIPFKNIPTLPDRLTAGTGTVAVRLPQSVFLRRLIERVGHPITATSANRSGGPDSLSAEEVLATLGGEVDRIIDGGVARSPLLSTLIDVTVTPPHLIREGAIPLAAIEVLWPVLRQSI